MPDRARDRVLQATLWNGIHLAVLWAFAIVQPLLDILGRNSTFFVVRDSTARDIVVLALVLTLVPPTVLALLELGAGLIDLRLMHVLNLFFVGALVGVFTLTVLTKESAPTGVAALGVAVAAGAAGALVYDRVRAARSFLSLLAPVPLVFVALFLFHSPVSKLVRAGQPEAKAATVTTAAARNRTPVVLILFDEFSTVALMDKAERIDARRYPNFASLARDATWYRNHSTMYWLSEGSVPSILTGRLPDSTKTPVLADYPDNVFTLLGRTRRVEALESISRLCPASLCGAARTTQAAAGRSGALASDVGIVYLHLLLPDPYVRHVAPIDDSWGNFGGKEKNDRELVSARSADIPACGRSICDFADSLTATGKPSFFFLDSSLPHVPYVYLPSGRRYAVDSRVLRGNDNGRWLDSWPAEQSYQRYLLQTGYTDLALGHILRKLRSTGLYDKSLVIVSADHGVSFNVGDQRRAPTATNLDDIAFVPLLVKLPGQKVGRVDDSLTRSIDILPTIADAVGLKPPWHVDGRSLLARPLPADGTVTVFGQGGRAVSSPLSVLREKRSRTLARQVAEFGTGPFSNVYRIGPNQGLLGRSIAAIPVGTAPGPGIDLDDSSLLNNVDLTSGFVPSYIEGALHAKNGPQLELAVAVNGRIAAVTRTFAQYGQRRFSAFVPETALRQGDNTVGIYAVRHAPAGLELDELRSSNRELRLAQHDGVDVISAPGGPTYKVDPGALTGTVRVKAEPEGYVFSGRASTPSNARVKSIAVFADSREVFVGRMADLRPQKLLGQTTLGELGYAFELPRSLLPETGSDTRLRVFALRYGVASELGYEADFPWAHGASG